MGIRTRRISNEKCSHFIHGLDFVFSGILVFMQRMIAAGAAWILLAACTLPSRMGETRYEGAQADSKEYADWSNISTNMMIEKYGKPDRVETRRLVWENRGPWKRILVWDEMGFFDNARVARNIEDTIAYEVPDDKREALKTFSLGLHVSAGGDELSARSSSEERNILLINLADDIVKGRLSPEDARLSYLRTLQLAAVGKSSPKMESLSIH